MSPSHIRFSSLKRQVTKMYAQVYNPSQQEYQPKQTKCYQSISDQNKLRIIMALIEQEPLSIQNKLKYKGLTKHQNNSSQ